MDIDRFITRNQPSWNRLDELSALARRGPKRMLPGELDELVQLYQRASAHLSYARVHFDDAGLLGRLTATVAAANGAIYGRRARAGGAARRFIQVTLPAAVWTSRRFVLASLLLWLVPAVVVGAWLANSDVALDVAIDESAQEALIESQFEDYYSSAPAAEFSAQVLLNNVRIAIMSFALGIAACLPAAGLLFYNGVHIGEAAGLFVAEGQAGKFFGLILPHGLLELTAVTIAAAAGLAVGWALLVPGDRTRSDALAEAGRRSVVLVLCAAGALVVSAVIEGFITPSSLPTGVRVLIGVVVEVAFLAWVLGMGRIAASEGFTGIAETDDAAWDKRGQSLPVALASR